VKRTTSIVLTLGLLVMSAFAQSKETAVNARPTASATPQAPDPVITQIRKSVVFIRLACLKDGQLWDVRGTGFFVGYPEPRLGDRDFVYLVTNRHVAMCWDEHGKPREVKTISVLLNLNKEENGAFAKEIVLNPNGNVPWFLPADDSIDLAAVPLVPDREIFDVTRVPAGIFGTKDVLLKNDVHEGEPLFFTGFFQQFPGRTRISPIVRQGIIAMMPDDKISIAGREEHLYLGDVHSFGGNSGSPVFINVRGFRNGGIIAGYDYRLLGIVNGEIIEDAKFNLELTATFVGTTGANSGVATIVPVDDLQSLLNGSPLQSLRDQGVAQYKKLHPETNPQATTSSPATTTPR
jgi:hypothetical protein